MLANEFPEYKESPGECVYCGNAPVSHKMTHFITTISVFMGIISKTLARYKLWKYLVRLISRAGAILDRYAYGLLHLLHIVSYAHDPARARTYRSQVVWEEANRRGISMEQIVMFGRYTDAYRAFINGRWIYFESLPIPPHLIGSSYAWMDDKYVLKNVLRHEGISVPHSFVATGIREARAAFEKIGGFAVVKPRSGTRGRHTITHVSATAQLDLAFSITQRLCHFVSIEEHLEGGVCRGTVVGGVLVGFFQALPPRIIGNGVSTIRELIAVKNASKNPRVQNIILTRENAEYINRCGYDIDSIIPDGETIDLGHRTGRLFGGHTRELLDTVHPRLCAYLERASRVLDVHVVGFDLIIENPDADPDGQKWGIIEANSLPFIDLHYLPLYGTPSNVAAAVWDLWNI
jgi:D-alanine-D-alanine ligase-like ATP-grasp enzyme